VTTLIYLDTKMSTTTATDEDALVHEGWETLVRRLGLQKATRFVVLLERGRGDSVEEISDYWGKSRLEEIHNEIIAWKAKRTKKGAARSR